MKQNESDDTRLYECNLSRCGEKCSYPDCHLTSEAEFAVNPDFWISPQNYSADDRAETNRKVHNAFVEAHANSEREKEEITKRIRQAEKQYQDLDKSGNNGSNGT